MIVVVEELDISHVGSVDWLRLCSFRVEQTVVSWRDRFEVVFLIDRRLLGGTRVIVVVGAVGSTERWRRRGCRRFAGSSSRFSVDGWFP